MVVIAAAMSTDEAKRSVLYFFSECIGIRGKWKEAYRRPRVSVQSKMQSSVIPLKPACIRLKANGLSVPRLLT